MRTIIALVSDAVLFSALSAGWGWILWKRLITNPILRNVVSVTTGWTTGGAIIFVGLMATAVKDTWLTWRAGAFLLTSYVPVLGAAILVGVKERRKKLAAPDRYGGVFE